MNNKKLVNAMNKQLANWNVLNTKLHHYHWYVTGNDFFTLHEKFEQLYNEAGAAIDEIAERILTIGGKPASTLSEYLRLSAIDEANGDESAQQMVAALSQDYDLFIKEITEVIELAEQVNDDPTADLFIGMKAAIQKHNWMLKAYLQRVEAAATV
ncbi:starvation-inducible DNA-binding protein [Evansella caseinilytica]|uniref:Starvation-inducible DNA-binding protein n=1 Tax=Evansella caseinilytica TaxID=1503961 RepID=A0A1H3QFU9_9BACI|nr:Dps family protein [Evansella caseinilytica]SDZ11599.1 starvation-inducible DNA-binding protein [Evansella caseinilytica]